MVDLEATLRPSLDGRYAIEGEVGRGGMSLVILATDLKHNRDVATIAPVEGLRMEREGP